MKRDAHTTKLEAVLHDMRPLLESHVVIDDDIERLEAFLALVFSARTHGEVNAETAGEYFADLRELRRQWETYVDAARAAEEEEG